MILQFVLVGLTFLALYLSLIKFSQRKHQNRKKFPGPLSLCPGIGGLLQLGVIKFKHFNKSNTLKAHEVNKVYGKTQFCEIGLSRFGTTEDFEVAKEILQSPDFHARFPSHPRYKELTLYKNMGILIGSDEPWKEMRKFVIKGLREYGFGELKASEALLEEELDYFLKRLDEDRMSSSTIDELCFHNYFKVAVFNTVWIVMSGNRFDYDDPAVHKMAEAVEKAAGIEIGFDLEWAYPILRFVPGLSQSRAKGWALEYCFKFFIDIMNKRRQTGSYKTSENNFIDAFLRKVDDEKDKKDSLYTDDSFLVTCCDITYTGIDTTANALEFLMLYLIKFQHVQQKCYEEILKVLGKDMMVTYSDISRFPYVRATMLETLRCAATVPMLGRTSTCDTYIQGHFIPEDTLMGINAHIILKDPEIWDKPQEFRPERFLDEDMNIINEDKLLVFGLGKRKCLGSTMAKVVIFKFLVTLVQRYIFEVSPAHSTLDLEPNSTIVNQPKLFYCLVKPRLQEAE